jgi:hypothetical protein
MSLITNKDQVNIVDKFTTDLENSLEKVCFSALWDADPPVAAEGATLLEYMRQVSYVI